MRGGRAAWQEKGPISGRGAGSRHTIGPGRGSPAAGPRLGEEEPGVRQGTVLGPERGTLGWRSRGQGAGLEPGRGGYPGLEEPG